MSESVTTAPSIILTDADTDTTPVVETRQLRCFNGPCQQAMVDAPPDAGPGTATALQWQTPKGEPRYAVYVVVEFQGLTGLMYLKSYDKPYKAAQRVREITAVCSVGIQS